MWFLLLFASLSLACQAAPAQGDFHPKFRKDEGRMALYMVFPHLKYEGLDEGLFLADLARVFMVLPADISRSNRTGPASPAAASAQADAPNAISGADVHRRHMVMRQYAKITIQEVSAADGTWDGDDDEHDRPIVPPSPRDPPGSTFAVLELMVGMPEAVGTLELVKHRLKANAASSLAHQAAFLAAYGPPTVLAATVDHVFDVTDDAPRFAPSARMPTHDPDAASHAGVMDARASSAERPPRRTTEAAAAASAW